MNEFFHVPEGTKIIHLFTDNTDQPVVIYFQNKNQQNIVQNLMRKDTLMRSALGLAMNAAFIGATAQIFPENYRQDLVEAFSEMD